MGAGLTNHAENFGRHVAALNEELMLGLVRQHELTEAANLLNAQLQTEMLTRKKAEEALVNSEKLASVGHMAAVLAHEINNPLEAVTNLLFLAMTAEGVPEPVRQYLLTADAELKRIAHMTRQTLGFYRESTAPAVLRVAALLDSVFDLLQAKIFSKQATVRRQCGEHLAINAFPGELRQVLSNLVMNSLDAIAEEGKVTVRASQTIGRSGHHLIRITVADNGEGISARALSQIFDPFFTTKGSVGNGLGLWVSKQIIEKHGGSIQVHSCRNGPRKGTTFSVVLPEKTA